MGAAHVKRGGGARTKSRTAPPRVAVPKKLARKLAVEQQQANRVATWAFGLFVAAIAVIALIALDVPNKLGLAAGEAVGDAGFRVKSVAVHGTRRMDPKPIYRIALDQRATALPLVDVAAIRQRLLAYGWVKDARVSRRYPDTLVVDIVERTPAALWQDGNRLSLIDDEGHVLDKVAVTRMPDLPLLVGAGANDHTRALDTLLGKAPTIRAQLVSASWIGQRRWDLAVQTGETIALPEGEAAAAAALGKFAEKDKSAGLLGRGIKWFDLRKAGQMTVRLPREPGEPIIPAAATES
ncbi:MAG: FtsQ-type POTRA domain-containing protein [Pseudomonadota bacterium]|nr:FtsQ-type POTRA domain-containing protein [Pseudomonadota bacterium]